MPTTCERLRQSGPALLVASALFMEMLDGTIVANALPHMAASFGVRPLDLDIGMTSYLVAVGGCIPLSGWMADRFGGRRVFVVAVLVFTIASLACALATGITGFVAARILQGAAAAMMTPVGRLLILRDLPKSELVHTIALLTWPALIAPAIAPPLGGAIVEHLSWRWIFLINLPVGCAGAFFGARLLPERKGQAARPDILGWLLWIGGCGLVIGLMGAATRLRPVWLLAGVLTLLALYQAGRWHWRRTRFPILDFSTLSVPSFGHGLLGGALVRMSIFAQPFLMPIFLQTALGFDAASSGMLIFIGMSGNLAMKSVTTPVLRRFAYRPLLLVNGTLVAIGFAAFAMVGPGTPVAAIAGLLFATGLGRSMHFTALNTLAFADIEADRMNGASTLVSTMYQLNSALGVAIAALAIGVSARIAGHVGVSRLVDLHIAFLITALLCLAGTLDAVRISAQHRAIV